MTDPMETLNTGIFVLALGRGEDGVVGHEILETGEEREKGFG